MTRPHPCRADGWLLAAWVAILAGCVAGLHAVGGDLSPPPLADADAVGAWLDHRPPVAAAFAGARLVALALAWYLLAATVAGILARASGVATLVRAADAASLPLVRRLVHGAAGLALVTATATGAGAGVAGAAAQPGPAAVEAMRLLPGGEAPPPPRMRLLPPPAGAASLDAGGTTAAPAGAPTWTVQPGDHLWAVAARVLGEAWGREPSDAEVDPYWRAVVDANRARLRDPGDPDRIFAGQVLEVPAPPARPA